MTKLKYFIPGKNKFHETTDNEESFKKLAEYINELIDNFTKEEKIQKGWYSDKLELVWIDLAQLEDNSNLGAIFSQFDSQKKFKDEFIPRVFIGSQSINSLNEENALNHHKKINQLDNNICTYYISVQEEKFFEEEFRNILKQIKFNFDKDLYNTTVVHEYYEYFQRILQQNKLKGGHSSQLLPMVFSSERRMRDFLVQNLEEIYGYIKGNRIDVKLLLIDDFGNANLRKLEEKTGNRKNGEIEELKVKQKNSKGSVLKDILGNLLREANPKVEFSFRIKVLDKADAPRFHSQAESFDIILLDYNFNEKANGVDFLREIIEKINDGSKSQSKQGKEIGPFDKFWIIPISSFSNAFTDEMQNKQISFVDERFELSRGADFINTPYLFLFHFTKMIKEIIGIANKVNEMTEDIEQLRDKLKGIKDWQEIMREQKQYEEMFKKHIIRKREINMLLEVKTETDGLLCSLRNLFCGNINDTKKKMNFYEQLLYNLAYRNYEGNEEIIIFHDLLKNQ